MARKVVVTLIDDFDGTSAAEDTVSFGIDGASYEIDLSGTSAAKLRDAFEQWIPYARRTGRIRGAARRTATGAPAYNSSRRDDLRAIRAWAVENGYTVSTRGRIAADVIAAFEKKSA